MQRLLLIVLPLLLIVGCSKEPINGETLIERSGVLYEVNGQKPYTGDVFELYDNGNKKLYGKIKDGKLVSQKQWTYYKNGDKRSEEAYKEEKNTLITVWDKNKEEYKGSLMIIDGTPWWGISEDGAYFHRKEKGSHISAFFNIKDSVRDGLFIKWDENDQKIYQGNFNKGIPDGLFTKWYKDGQKKFEGIIKSGEEDGLHTYWKKNGEKRELENYKFGKLINKWTFSYNYHDNGNILQERPYNEDRKLDGLLTEWYKNEQIKYSRTYKNGRLEGLFKSWYENGKKAEEGFFKDEKLYGLLTQWYENGEKRGEVNYKDGNKEGLESVWFENGNKKSEINFNDGKKNGLDIRWYENGQKGYEGTYKDGKFISSKQWNEDGSVKE